MALFLSTIETKIDAKGRTSVPAGFRAAATRGTDAAADFQGVVLFRSPRHACLEGCSMARMEQLAASVDGLDLFSDAQDDLAATLFADAHPLGFDPEGRIQIPAELAAHAGLDRRCAFVGRGKTFQIWEPDAFARHRDAARARLQEAGTTLAVQPAAEGAS